MRLPGQPTKPCQSGEEPRKECESKRERQWPAQRIAAEVFLSKNEKELLIEMGEYNFLYFLLYYPYGELFV